MIYYVEISCSFKSINIVLFQIDKEASEGKNLVYIPLL